MPMIVRWTVKAPVTLVLAGSGALYGCSPGESGSASAHPPVVRFEILDVESPPYGGLSFGDVGAYEFLFARAWVAIDPSRATDEILEGDVVRPIENESLLASLSGPNCGSILEVR